MGCLDNSKGNVLIEEELKKKHTEQFMKYLQKRRQILRLMGKEYKLVPPGKRQPDYALTGHNKSLNIFGMPNNVDSARQHVNESDDTPRFSKSTDLNAENGIDD